MMSGEASYPRKNLKRAFKTIYLRFGLFFIGGALACGIVIPYNDPNLIAILSGNSAASGTAASSPYVIAMQNLGIGVLPHLTNALLVTSIFSAGNSYVCVDHITLILTQRSRCNTDIAPLELYTVCHLMVTLQDSSRNAQRRASQSGASVSP